MFFYHGIHFKLLSYIGNFLQSPDNIGYMEIKQAKLRPLCLLLDKKSMTQLLFALNVLIFQMDYSLWHDINVYKMCTVCPMTLQWLRLFLLPSMQLNKNGFQSTFFVREQVHIFGTVTNFFYLVHLSYANTWITVKRTWKSEITRVWQNKTTLVTSADKDVECLRCKSRRGPRIVGEHMHSENWWQRRHEAPEVHSQALIEEKQTLRQFAQILQNDGGGSQENYLY